MCAGISPRGQFSDSERSVHLRLAGLGEVDCFTVTVTALFQPVVSAPSSLIPGYPLDFTDYGNRSFPLVVTAEARSGGVQVA